MVLCLETPMKSGGRVGVVIDGFTQGLQDHRTRSVSGSCQKNFKLKKITGVGDGGLDSLPSTIVAGPVVEKTLLYPC